MKEDDKKNNNQFLLCVEININMFKSFVSENCPHIALDDELFMGTFKDQNYEKLRYLTHKYCNFKIQCESGDIPTEGAKVEPL